MIIWLSTFWARASVLVVVAVACQATSPVAPPAASPSPSASAVASVSAEPSPSPTALPTPSPAPTPYPVTLVIPGGTNFPVIAAGSVWAPRFNEGDLVRADLASGQVQATIPISIIGSPGADIGPHAIATRGDEVWVNGRDVDGWWVMRIDTQTNQIGERISVPAHGWAIAIVGDTLWMSSFHAGRVYRIDLAARELVASVVVPSAVGIAAGEDGVWVASGGSGYIVRIDPMTNEPRQIRTNTDTATVPLLVDDELWLTTLYSRQVVILSRRTDEVLGRVNLQYPNGLTHAGDLIWVSDHRSEGRIDERIVAIDIATRQIVGELPLPGVGIDRGITTDGESIWFVSEAGVSRLDIPAELRGN